MTSSRSSLLPTLLLLTAAGCGDGSDTGSLQPPADPPPADERCSPGELPRTDGTCRPAGMLPEGCASGFVPSGSGSCEPVLPAEPCAPGTFAVPGDAQCVPVGDCTVEPDLGAGPLIHVDGGYTGPGSDGSAERPWPTVQQAIDAAPTGATVLLAAGLYEESVTVQGKSLQVVGVCPQQVEIRGEATEAAVRLLQGADGSSLQGVAITGATGGVIVSDALDARLEAVWIHDTSAAGLSVEDSLGPASASMSASLIERSAMAAALVSGAELDVQGSALRDVALASGFSRGLNVQPGYFSDEPGRLTLRQAQVERVAEYGVYVSGSQATIERTVVQETGDQPGKGILVSLTPSLMQRSIAELHDVVVATSRGQGILVVGSDLSAEHVLVRDTFAPSADTPATGVLMIDDATETQRSSVVLRASVVEGSHGFGVLLGSSDGTLESIIVRDTVSADVPLGAGIAIQNTVGSDTRAWGHIRGSRIVRNAQTGIQVEGSDALIELCAVEDTRLSAQGTFGRGIDVEENEQTLAPSFVDIRDTLVQGSHDVGILLIGSNGSVVRTTILDSRPGSDGVSGRGLQIQVPADEQTSLPASPELTAVELTVEQVHEAGVFVVGAHAILQDLTVRHVAPTAVVGFGDGVTVLGGHWYPRAMVEIAGARLEHNARAGIANFGSTVRIRDMSFGCHAFYLNGEAVVASPFEFHDEGGNLCECDGTAMSCQVVSSGLSPPEPL